MGQTMCRWLGWALRPLGCSLGLAQPTQPFIHTTVGTQAGLMIFEQYWLVYFPFNQEPHVTSL